MAPIAMHDLAGQHAALGAALGAAIERVLASQRFVLGPEVEAFERELAAVLGAADVVGCSSGTDGLVLALTALGIGAGDEVITTSLSFVATAEAIVRVGARPVFADVEPGALTLDVASAASLVGPRTRAIVPVHLYGQTADMRAVMALAARHGLAVVEDAAQAIGARDADGRVAGTIGDLGVSSFFPTKNLGAAGDAGAVIVPARGDGALARRLRSLRVHGYGDEPDDYVEGGMNARLDALQAAVLRVKLPHLEAWTAARRRNALEYSIILSDIPGISVPTERAGGLHVFNQYTVRVRERDALAARLGREGIASAVYYRRPMHRMRCFAGVAGSIALPEAERAADEVISLPVHPGMSRDDVARVAAVVRAHAEARQTA
ncbi:DegT/DnrJ/EryC1/StrS family aminotransferase [Myxococcota bacterium]|nr:DegT/DnrJ/EryC1/StrS family aminotransferase [Myxococcota bacterium]